MQNYAFSSTLPIFFTRKIIDCTYFVTQTTYDATTPNLISNLETDISKHEITNSDHEISNSSPQTSPKVHLPPYYPKDNHKFSIHVNRQLHFTYPKAILNRRSLRIAEI